MIYKLLKLEKRCEVKVMTKYMYWTACHFAKPINELLTIWTIVHLLVVFFLSRHDTTQLTDALIAHFSLKPPVWLYKSEVEQPMREFNFIFT